MDNKDKHTKGKVRWDLDYNYLMVDERAECVLSAEGYSDGDRELDIRPADGRHIAALWNMAEELNLSTEDIEGGIVQDAFGALREVEWAGTDGSDDTDCCPFCRARLIGYYGEPEDHEPSCKLDNILNKIGG